MDNTIQLEKVIDYLNAVNIFNKNINTNTVTPFRVEGESFNQLNSHFSQQAGKKAERRDTKKVELITQPRIFKKANTLKPHSERVQIDAEATKKKQDKDKFTTNYDPKVNYQLNVKKDQINHNSVG